MSFFAVIFIAVGLSMDALAVSIASGSSLKERKIPHALRLGLTFGIFQALMPLLGAFVGMRFRHLISSFDHWIAFAILAGIGAKMIYEAHFIEEEEKKNPVLDNKTLLLLAVATSMDALAAGFSLSLVAEEILLIAAVIGIMTFAVCFIGVLAGEIAGHFFEEKIETAGGIILVAIGAKILLSHLFQ